MRRREKKLLLSSSLFISHNSWNVWTALWGCEWAVWMTGEEEVKETTKTPTTLSPASTSPRLWDAKFNFLQTSPLIGHGHLGFSMSKTGHIISPSFSQTCFSSYTPHLLVSQNQSHILDAFIFIHCHIYHLIDLTNFSFKIFWVDKLLFFFSLKLLPWLRSSSSLPWPVFHVLSLKPQLVVFTM